MRIHTRLITAAFAVTALAGAGITAASGASAVTNTLTAHTAMSNRDDSAANTTGNTNGGNWAVDTFTRGAQITFKGAASASHCGSTSPCYAYTGKVSDVGHFTTDAGQPSPGFGDLNGGSDPTMAVSAQGTLSGSQTYAFYSSTPVSGASASFVPTSESGDAVGSGEWPEQFFPGTASFWDQNGNAQPNLATGGAELGTGTFKYLYTAKPGMDADCPNVSSQWLDASPDGGSLPSSGNIILPDSASC